MSVATKTETTGLPDPSAALAPLFEACPPSERYLLLAVLERIAAGKYREWSRIIGDPEKRRAFDAAAEREEEVAEVLESMSENASWTVEIVKARVPRPVDVYAEIFEPLAFDEQLVVQATAERAGAALLRTFAEEADDPGAKSRLAALADLEEENAETCETARR